LDGEDGMDWFKKTTPMDIDYKEDPKLYGPVFKNFRQIMRKYKGVVPCKKCSSMHTLNLIEIENSIRKNITRQKLLKASKSELIILPDWKYGAVCLKCVAYICNNCVSEAFRQKPALKDQTRRVMLRYASGNTPPEVLEIDLESTRHTVLCPICQDYFLLGVDHITD